MRVGPMRGNRKGNRRPTLIHPQQLKLFRGLCGDSGNFVRTGRDSNTCVYGWASEAVGEGWMVDSSWA